VEFEEREDAAAALDNMNNAELYGRVLKVNIAKPMKIKLGSAKPVWAEADDWYKDKLKEDGFEAADAPASLQPE
jgi:peptidyl-prolyl isomerase E (cyclophilin E)